MKDSFICIFESPLLEAALKRVIRNYRTQALMVSIFAGMVCVTAATVKRLEDNVAKLKKEVEELKKEKGE